MKRSSILLLAALSLGVARSVFGATCTVTDTSSLQYCLDQGAAVDYFNLQSDLTCSGNCCGTTGALINLNGRSGVTFQGNGHVITRTSQQTACPALSIASASGIVIQSLRIDEDESAPRCLGASSCSPSVQVVGSTSITMEGVGIYNAKMVGVYVTGTNGFTFNNSVVSNAGVQGILVGENAANSDNIWITNSVIAHTGSNGLTLIGVMGNPSGVITNVVRDNVFDTNHIWGAYHTPAHPNDFNNGGQIYVPHARSVTIENNVIADGRCDNCGGDTGYATIPAFELGAQPASGGGPIDYVLFHANKIRNTYGPAFYKGSGAQISSTTAIWENDLRGVTGGLWNPALGLSGPTIGSNAIGDYSPSANSYGYLSNFIQRMNSGSYHQEANWTWQHPNSYLEATYGLLGYPRAHGPMRPVYRCLVSSGTGDDFPSLDANCEGWTLHSILGYSYEPGFPGAVPLYRCLTGYDHFVSTDPNCEGAVNEGHLAYVVPQ